MYFFPGNLSRQSAEREYDNSGEKLLSTCLGFCRWDFEFIQVFTDLWVSIYSFLSCFSFISDRNPLFNESDCMDSIDGFSSHQIHWNSRVDSWNYQKCQSRLLRKKLAAYLKYFMADSEIEIVLKKNNFICVSYNSHQRLSNNIT